MGWDMGSRTKSVLIGLLILLSTEVRADDNCLDQAKIDLVQTKITLQTDDNATFDRCKPGSKTYAMLEAILLINSVRFSDGALGRPFNQDILPNDFWDYFSTRVKTVSNESTCTNGVLAFVFGGMGDGQVHICPAFYKPEISVYERVQVMLHEARHFAGFRHVTCNRGPRKGDGGACDETIDEKGSYAVTVEALSKMAMLAQGVPHAKQSMLKLLALTYANETFNTPTRARDLSSFYLVGNDHRGYMYSDKGLIEVAAIENAIFISRTVSLAVFPTDKADAFTVDVFSAKMNPMAAMGTFSAQYNGMPKAGRPAVIDILNLGYLSAAITSNYIDGDLKAGNLDRRIPLPWTVKAAFSGTEFGVPDQDSIYVMNTDNKVFRVQFLPQSQSSITEVDGSSLAGFLRLAEFNGQRLGLNADGQLQVDLGGAWKPFEALQDKRFSTISRPFLWDEFFEDQTEQAVAGIL